MTHNWRIAEETITRADAARGRSDPIAVIAEHTAHIAVDLQIGFMGEGALAEVPMAREIVGQVNRLSAAVRLAGGLNVFLRMTVDLAEARAWDSLYGRMAPEALAEWATAFGAGGPQHRLWPGLDVSEGDLVIDKTRYSAFIPGASRLDEVLKARGTDTLIVTGTLTNCCCESTVRDAMQLGYKVLFVADAAAAHDEAAHNATLASLVSLYFADVVTTDEAIARLRAADRPVV